MAAIKDYRHEMRLAGCWGACYEVSCFIEHRYGFRRFDGVYQLSDGTPVFKHSWNVTPDGGIIDGTADQFFHGEDVATHGAGDPRAVRYREKFTRAHNPARVDWLAAHTYIGMPDEEFWSTRYSERRLGPGWWLLDNSDYLAWLNDNADRYWLFARKREEYQTLGYDCAV
ncbi:hypothetical protein [Rhizobium sp. RU36D]|uniref:hypothetical protein n=1 Tax=Rhizobium sp. RU36D TaxID=1907415 RepID=UPI00117A13E5|nr:hypothetical protein [Rhizobium sp. RU36D]